MKDAIMPAVFGMLTFLFIMVLIKKEILEELSNFFNKKPKFVKIILYIAIITGLIFIIRNRNKKFP